MSIIPISTLSLRKIDIREPLYNRFLDLRDYLPTIIHKESNENLAKTLKINF